ncbi:TetR family transcriptional regulator [Spirillospora sp. NPDC029432]|uniref:TetR family transcriptional regulator n=1 Tax=Spirillospora sp. NPDC029432 TaxID=3154599 RepID=UPI00345735B8
MTAEPTATERGVRSRSQHQRRRRIVQAGAALASRGGVEAMQMRTVAERAGVALGTLYRYFPSKMDLVVAVVSEELNLLEASIERRPPRAEDPARRAIDVLMRACRGLMREPELAEALIRSLLLSDAKTDFHDFGRRMGAMLLRAAAGAADTGDIPEDDPRRVVVRALTGVWTMEMIELLRGTTTADEIQGRLETIAARLLTDF